MPSRTARKRERRRKARQQATANPANPIVERWGWAQPAPSIAGDLALIRQAIRERWGVPAATRKHLIDAICHVALTLDGPNETEGLRDELAIRAVRVIIDAEWAIMLLARDTLAARRTLIRGILPGWRAWRRSIDPPAYWPTDEPIGEAPC